MAQKLKDIEFFGLRANRRLTIVLAIAATFGLLAWLAGLPPGAAVLGFAGLAGLVGWLLRGGVLDARAPAETWRRPPVEDGTSMRDVAVSAIGRFPDPVVVLDDEGRIVLSNKDAHPLIQAAEVGRHISGVVRSPSVLQALGRVLDGGAEETVEFTTPVPIVRHLMAFCVPLRLPRDPSETSASDSALYVLLVLHDLTAAKRVEQMRVDFVANASHELKTPLASLSGFIETLRGPAKDDEAARENFLSIMEEQATRMKRLIDDLLSLSRIELNEHVLPGEKVDLLSVVRDVIDGLAPIAEQNGVEIKLMAPDGLPFALGSRHELFQVFQNMIDNAVKYGRSGGKVDVTLARTENSGKICLRVEVRDYGPGIAREHIPRLTERFYRIDPDKSRREGGTGLGLAIVKHIVNRHQGDLEIESRIGEGSTFVVKIPTAPDSVVS